MKQPWTRGTMHLRLDGEDRAVNLYPPGDERPIIILGEHCEEDADRILAALELPRTDERDLWHEAVTLACSCAGPIPMHPDLCDACRAYHIAEGRKEAP